MRFHQILAGLQGRLLQRSATVKLTVVEEQLFGGYSAEIRCRTGTACRLNALCHPGRSLGLLSLAQKSRKWWDHFLSEDQITKMCVWDISWPFRWTCCGCWGCGWLLLWLMRADAHGSYADALTCPTLCFINLYRPEEVNQQPSSVSQHKNKRIEGPFLQSCNSETLCAALELPSVWFNELGSVTSWPAAV